MLASTGVAGHDLVGRDAESAVLQRAFAELRRSGRGDLCLISGEAGVGKTRLAWHVIASSGLRCLSGADAARTMSPYAPIVAVFRAFLRVQPGGLLDSGPLSQHLALLLPELGAAPEHGDRPALFEAIRGGFEAIAAREPTVVFLDDLQWADDTTLELLPTLSSTLGHVPLLLLGAYRSDEIPRGHPLRRLRLDLRRAGRLNELVVHPLDADGTARVAEGVLGHPLSPSLAWALHDRTQGLPFFVEELTAALRDAGRLSEAAKRGAEGQDAVVPLPDTVRDAILLRVAQLSEPGRSALDAAAVAGLRFELDVLLELAPEDGVIDAIEAGFLVEPEAGVAAFRHALMQEAVYGTLPWTRRRAMHRRLAERLEAAGAPPARRAEHWLGAREPTSARLALAEAAAESCAVHAYRDAAQFSRRALEIWTTGEDEEGRVATLERLGSCAELAGDLADAARAWREVADARSARSDDLGLGVAQRHLATVLELQAAWEPAVDAREAAAAAFVTAGRPDEAATERLSAASHLQSAGRLASALRLVELARPEAATAGRADLEARAMGLEGAVRAKLGDVDAGRALAREGLSLALAHNLPGAAAETYQKLATVLENASDYVGARAAYETAFDFCQARGVSGMAEVCMGCLAYILRQTGEWDRALRICDEVLAGLDSPLAARVVAYSQIGLIQSMRGNLAAARQPLSDAGAQAARAEFLVAELEAAYGVARVHALEGRTEAAVERCRFILQRWRTSDDRHYAVPTLRWCSTHLASAGQPADSRACAEALAEIAAETGGTEALAALAHALGESALVDGDAPAAARQFSQALDLLDGVEVPFDRAETEVRAAVALAASGERDAAVEHLRAAFRTARRLGAAPLAEVVVRQLGGLGESVERRLGVRAADAMRGGLSRRELEVLRLVAAGRTNREIAGLLVLSQRTVDMHVRNILGKLGCRGRLEAATRAREMELLDA